MPRAGLDTAGVVAAAAVLADEIGFAELTMARVAERLGVRGPSLYKHVSSQDDLNRRIAALALVEAGDAIGVAVQGRAGRDALAAAAQALRAYVLTHPGRYAATLGAIPSEAQDPVALAAIRGMQPFEAVLRGYDIRSADMTDALRALRSAFHGFATLQATGGFQWAADVDQSFDWLIDLVHRGLSARSATSGTADVDAAATAV